MRNSDPSYDWRNEPPKKRKERTRITRGQKAYLEEYLNTGGMPDAAEHALLADVLGLDTEYIYNWYVASFWLG